MRWLVAAAAMVGALMLASMPACAQTLAPAPLVVAPVMAPTPKAVSPAPKVLEADTHVDSVELGFEKGVGPAVGRTVTFRHKVYEVTDVVSIGGGPTFCGNSRFTVASAGHGLSVGLKAVEPEKIAALPSSLDVKLN